MNEPTFKRTPATRGECFHNAYFFVDQNPAWEVVHGIPLGRGPIEGVRYAHAWCEITHDGIRWVYDPFTRVLMPAGVFYWLGVINYSVTYTYHEISALVRKHGHTGPWDDKVNQAEGR